MNKLTGLTTSQAQENLLRYGKNELPSVKTSSMFSLLISQFKNMLVVLLMIAVVISWAVGDMVDAVLILFILVLNACLGFWQEYKANHELEVLRKMEVILARVIRDGRQMQINATELVPGDLIVLESGDKIPADAQVLESHELQVNEAALTGESAPIFKTTDTADNVLFFGTNVVSGRGIAKITATGAYTRFGKIALELVTQKEEQTVLETSLNNLAEKVGIAALVVSLLIFSLRIYQGFELFDVFLTSIALIVAAVPEGLPAVIAIVLSIGVHRMYKHKTIIRKMDALQDLGAVTVICTDKTGTITKNEMRVQEVFSETKNYSNLLECALLCNSASLIKKEDGSFDVLGDSTEAALLLWGQEEKNTNVEDLRNEYTLLDEMPFSLEKRMMASVWKLKDRTEVFVKGAPEVVLNLVDLPQSEYDRLIKEYEKLSSKGLRVLAFASKKLVNIPKKLSLESLEKDLNFLGFIGIADEARPEVKDAIRKTKQAGIKVVMITGDNELTAKAIAEEVGLLEKDDEIISGKQLDELSDEALLERIEKIKVYARVIPEHKLRIVKAFQSKGEIVAVTGDGVNDALALKQAHVGIAMGKTGTDVAKETSDLIILDDNFATIVSAIEQGRLTYSNIMKVLKFLMTGNLSEILLIVFATLANLPSPLLAVQILWINFVTDGFPALALAADSASSHIMKIPPRKNPKVLLDKSTIHFTLFSGIIIAVLNFWVFFLLLLRFDENIARGVTFCSVVVSQMVFVFMLRKHHSIWSNKYLLYSVGFVLVLQAMIMTLPFLREIFKIF